jgi:hypothetical protein
MKQYIEYFQKLPKFQEEIVDSTGQLVKFTLALLFQLYVVDNYKISEISRQYNLPVRYITAGISEIKNAVQKFERQ